MNSKKELFSNLVSELSTDAEVLKNTPQRADSAYSELLNGYNKNYKDVANAFFPSEMNDIIILKDISFESFCEHHIVPIIGTVSIGYIPNGQVIGASKLARLVDCFAHRLQLQERFTIQLSEALEKVLNPIGTAVYVIGEHFCISRRGAKKEGAKFITRYFSGAFKQDYNLRQEFLNSVI